MRHVSRFVSKGRKLQRPSFCPSDVSFEVIADMAEVEFGIAQVAQIDKSFWIALIDYGGDGINAAHPPAARTLQLMRLVTRPKTV